MSMIRLWSREEVRDVATPPTFGHIIRWASGMCDILDKQAAAVTTKINIEGAYFCVHQLCRALDLFLNSPAQFRP